MLRSRAFVVALVSGLAACGGDAGAAPQEAPPAVAARPRLVVVVSVDQLRADYLPRFADLFLPPPADGKPGGFRWFMERQAWFADAHHDHFPTYTGPGHAVLLTGAPPYKNGIVGNVWYDRALGRRRYCCEGKADPARPTEPRVSAETLLVTTLGDELETVTGGRAKTWSFGLKDRAAILMAGHIADGVWWLGEESGGWETSPAYGGNGKAPQWLRAVNAENVPASCKGTAWECSVGEAALARTWVPPGSERPKPFRHELEPESFFTSPLGNDWTLRTALLCVENEKLGEDDVPDVLTINLSSNDYVGHRFGPDSAEVLDITVRTDRALAEFFAAVAAKVPGGAESVVFAITSDHGVAPNPPRAAKSGLPAGVHPDDDRRGVSPQRAAVEAALDKAFGAAEWTAAHVESNLYLSDAAFAAHPEVDREKAQTIAADVCARSPGMFACYTRAQILSGRMPATQVARAVTLGYHTKACGDVVLVPESMFTIDRGTGATHGSTWNYDTAVPLLLGGGAIRAGRHRARASTIDLAPTLAEIIGVPKPSGSEGRILAEALR